MQSQLVGMERVDFDSPGARTMPGKLRVGDTANFHKASPSAGGTLEKLARSI